MFLFLLCISTSIPNTYYISSDLVISCLDDDISKYQHKSVSSLHFKYKEDIMKSQEFQDKIKKIKEDPIFIKINQLPSKVKIILFMYQGNPMMMVHRSIIFLSSFFEFYDLVIEFYTRLYSSREDILLASRSLYEELSSIYLGGTRMKGVTSNDVFIMVNHTILEIIRYKPEIYNFNLTINSRSSESLLLGFYFISNVLNFRVENSVYIDFGNTSLHTKDRIKLLQNYDIMNQYRISCMCDLVDMFVTSFLTVEVKTKILDKQRRLFN